MAVTYILIFIDANSDIEIANYSSVLATYNRDLWSYFSIFILSDLVLISRETKHYQWKKLSKSILSNKS